MHTILYGYRGSIAHNTYIPPDNPMATDDEDYMGIVIADIDCYFGLKHYEGHERKEGAVDEVMYDIRKFFNLLVKSNPNVISFLWMKPEHYTIMTSYGDRLIKERNLFSSQRAYDAFYGYALSQYKKMMGGSYCGYMGAKRKELFNRFGYDVKNASHLVRLLTMCDEFLRTGEMIVFRPDAEKYIEIKQGKWSLGQIENECQRLFKQVEAAKKVTCLPEEPDIEKINWLLVDTMEAFFAER